MFGIFQQTPSIACANATLRSHSFISELFLPSQATTSRTHHQLSPDLAGNTNLKFQSHNFRSKLVSLAINNVFVPDFPPETMKNDMKHKLKVSNKMFCVKIETKLRNLLRRGRRLEGD